MISSSVLKNPTINDREHELESAIEAVQHLTSRTSQDELQSVIARLRELLFPVGYKVRVQLEEDGRKKRSNADASYWSFHSGEMVMFYEPNTDSGIEEQMSVTPQTPPTPLHVVPASQSVGPSQNEAAIDLKLNVVQEDDIQRCVDALDEAEKLGKQFIAYKWFRDLVLAGLPYSWARDAEQRQQVLSAAVESGRISIQKIPNPRQPMFPTTTLSINRTGSAAGVKSRFRPIQVIGEPVSATLLRDRG
jgi:hypothetical protein